MFFKKKDVSQNLREAYRFLKKIPNINRGGCGYAALALYLWLEKNENYIPKIYFCYRKDTDERYISNSCAQFDNKSLRVPNHVMVEYKGRMLDVDGAWHPVAFENEYRKCHQVSLKQLRLTIEEIWDWNDEFNRSYVDVIETKLNVNIML